MAATGRRAGCSSSIATTGPATLDITEFAPRSVKSDGDFEDILAADNPDVWVSNRPAKTGETGAMLADIIKKAAALKAQRETKETKAEKAPAKARRAAQDAAQDCRAIEAEDGSETALVS